MKAPVAYAVARATADDVVERLAGTYLQLAIAGSIRRQAHDVGDIEIVCEPIMQETLDGLWSEPATVNMVRDRLGRGVFEGWLREGDRPAKGDRYVRCVHAESGLQLDVFMVTPPAQFGVILAIRTGPAKWSQWLVTEAKRRGYHVAHGALHAGGLGHADPDACRCEVIPTPDEETLFRLLGIPWVDPDRRSVS